MRHYFEKTHHRIKAGGVARGVVPEFKHQYKKDSLMISLYPSIKILVRYKSLLGNMKCDI
jgi:hypothetical protein